MTRPMPKKQDKDKVTSKKRTMRAVKKARRRVLFKAELINCLQTMKIWHLYILPTIPFLLVWLKSTNIQKVK